MLLKWKQEDTTGVLYYEIEVDGNSKQTLIRTAGVVSAYNIEDLHPKTNYQIRIRAVVLGGEKGEWTAERSIFTGK